MSNEAQERAGAEAGHADPFDAKLATERVKQTMSTEPAERDARRRVEYGRKAYEAYCKETGGKSAVTGQPLPSFTGQKPEIQRAWVAAAMAVLDALD